MTGRANLRNHCLLTVLQERLTERVFFMLMQDHLVRFSLFGQEFTFYSDATEEDVDAVLALLRQALEEGGLYGRSSVPSSKMLVLACLRIAAQCIQLQREHDQYCQAQEKVIARLLEKISSAMDASA